MANWQFLHCISLWSHVLAEVSDDSLQSLVFPLVQVTTGVMQCVAHTLLCVTTLKAVSPPPLLPLPPKGYSQPTSTALCGSTVWSLCTSLHERLACSFQQHHTCWTFCGGRGLSHPQGQASSSWGNPLIFPAY